MIAAAGIAPIRAAAIAAATCGCRAGAVSPDSSCRGAVASPTCTSRAASPLLVPVVAAIRAVGIAVSLRLGETVGSEIGPGASCDLRCDLRMIGLEHPPHLRRTVHSRRPAGHPAARPRHRRARSRARRPLRERDLVEQPISAGLVGDILGPVREQHVPHDAVPVPLLGAGELVQVRRGECRVRHNASPFCLGLALQLLLQPWPSPRPGVARGRASAGEGVHPPAGPP